MISNTSRQDCKCFAIVQVIGYIPPSGSSFQTSIFTFKYTLVRHSFYHKNVLFLIPQPKEGRKQKISLHVV